MLYSCYVCIFAVEVVGGKVFLCFEMHEHNLMMTYQYTHSSDSCVDIFKHNIVPFVS